MREVSGLPGPARGKPSLPDREPPGAPQRVREPVVRVATRSQIHLAVELGVHHEQHLTPPPGAAKSGPTDDDVGSRVDLCPVDEADTEKIEGQLSERGPRSDWCSAESAIDVAAGYRRRTATAIGERPGERRVVHRDTQVRWSLDLATPVFGATNRHAGTATELSATTPR